MEEEEGKKFREISLETYDGIEEKGQYPPSILRRISLCMKSIEINGKVLMIISVYLQYGIKTKLFRQTSYEMTPSVPSSPLRIP